MTTLKPKYFQRQNISLLFRFKSDIRIFIVIPVFADTLIFDVLRSLSEAYLTSSDQEKKQIGIIIVLNHPEFTTSLEKEVNESIFNRLQNNNYPFPIYTIFKKDVPDKIAGVGYARKIGMDQAALFFHETNNLQGIIVSLDADTTVSRNYFSEIIRFFHLYKNAVGANIFFEHPLAGQEFSENIYDAITKYELHLRYFIEALRYINFPYAYHTIGSAFAVRAKNYIAAQGISTRQGGEDFYFLNKLFYQGPFGEINTTCVFPLPRPNNKTPFGTGIAIQKILDSSRNEFLTYNLDAFLCIKELFGKIDLIRENDISFFEKKIISAELYEFLKHRNFSDNIKKIKQNSPSFAVFKKSFFRWFDMFTIVKFLNETARKGIFPKKIILLEANHLISGNMQAKQLLLHYRHIQKKESAFVSL